MFVGTVTLAMAIEGHVLPKDGEERESGVMENARKIIANEGKTLSTKK